jgi:F0F1-type ATP synthase delta subunit
VPSLSDTVVKVETLDVDLSTLDPDALAALLANYKIAGSSKIIYVINVCNLKHNLLAFVAKQDDHHLDDKDSNHIGSFVNKKTAAKVNIKREENNVLIGGHEYGKA